MILCGWIINLGTDLTNRCIDLTARLPKNGGSSTIHFLNVEPSIHHHPPNPPNPPHHTTPHPPKTKTKGADAEPQGRGAARARGEAAGAGGAAVHGRGALPQQPVRFLAFGLLFFLGGGEGGGVCLLSTDRPTDRPMDGQMWHLFHGRVF